MPAKPGLRLRLITITSRAWSTSMIGMPAIGESGPSLAGGWGGRVVCVPPALLQLVGELLDRVLCLGDRHAVAGDEDDRVGVAELDRGVLGADRVDRALLTLAGAGRRRAEAGKRQGAGRAG